MLQDFFQALSPKRTEDLRVGPAGRTVGRSTWFPPWHAVDEFLHSWADARQSASWTPESSGSWLRGWETLRMLKWLIRWGFIVGMAKSDSLNRYIYIYIYYIYIYRYIYWLVPRAKRSGTSRNALETKRQNHSPHCIPLSLYSLKVVHEWGSSPKFFPTKTTIIW